MTFSKLTETKVGITVWSWVEDDGARTTRINVGSAVYADLTEDQRRELAVYLLQGTTPPGPPNPPHPENDRPVA